MKDFTLAAYSEYLKAIKTSYSNILRFCDYFSLQKSPESFIIIRHDVDRKPKNALRMALLESEMGIYSTYYFRTRPHTFHPQIISNIAKLGHEIGYHYEDLSDAKGDEKAAIRNFKTNLASLRQIVPVRTIAMHGSPLSRHDNRDLWRIPKNHELLHSSLQIFGEVYLDINYIDIAYITDTGRNWRTDKSNRRDLVISKVKPFLENSWSMLDCLQKARYHKLILQVHPERWSGSNIEYFTQWTRDLIANFTKASIRHTWR